MYLLNQPSQLLELLDLVLQILQRVPVSLKNDCNHQIRKCNLGKRVMSSYCYLLFNKMLRKGVTERGAKARMLSTAFQVGEGEWLQGSVSSLKMRSTARSSCGQSICSL